MPTQSATQSNTSRSRRIGAFLRMTSIVAPTRARKTINPALRSDPPRPLKMPGFDCIRDSGNQRMARGAVCDIRRQAFPIIGKVVSAQTGFCEMLAWICFRSNLELATMTNAECETPKVRGVLEAPILRIADDVDSSRPGECGRLCSLCPLQAAGCSKASVDVRAFGQLSR